MGCTQIQSILVSITGGWEKRQNLLNLQYPVDHLDVRKVEQSTRTVLHMVYSALEAVIRNSFQARFQH